MRIIRRTLTPDHRLLLVIPLLLALLVAGPAAAQGGGSGAVIEGNPNGAAALESFNPLRCTSAQCIRVTDFLFPALLAVDPVRGVVVPADQATTDRHRFALTTDWQANADGTAYTLQLRDDLAWSDGAPVTAYDVFYSYLAVASGDFFSPYHWRVDGDITGAAPLDAHRINFFVDAASCDNIAHLNFPVIPAHLFAPDFAAGVQAAFDVEGDLLAQYTAWAGAREDAGEDFVFMQATPLDEAPFISAGLFEFDTLTPTEYIRLLRDGGTQGFALVDTPDSRSAAARFVMGDVNFIENPPFRDWADISAANGAQVAEYPGLTWDFINLNLADPADPQSAFDMDGTPLAQGQHPIFGDLRVRRALQLAIDIEEIIDVVALGHGTVMPANMLPTSWAFDDSLAPVGYDPVEAARLLEAAGWKDTNFNGVRECITCLYAEEGDPLTFDLLYLDNAARRGLMADLIRQDWLAVGANASVRPVSNVDSLLNQVQQQRYDAYLVGWTELYPFAPDQSALFSRAADVLQDDAQAAGLNTNSYYNPEVDALLAEAQNFPGCEIDGRAALYRDVQRILQADQPYLWLFAPHEMAATGESVTGFAPLPYAPLWNITEWVVRP